MDWLMKLMEMADLGLNFSAFAYLIFNALPAFIDILLTSFAQYPR